MVDAILTERVRRARRALRSAPSVARRAYGMSYRDAYAFVFRKDLDERLAELCARYPSLTPADFLSWELEAYGWRTPHQLRAALGPVGS